MKIIRWGVAGFAGAALALAAAGSAQAHHNSVDTDVTVDGCTLTATTSWTLAEHTVGNTVLVLRIDGEVHSAAIGEPLELELVPGTTEVEWRVWGGGERAHDNPPLTDLAALVAHLEAGGGELDADAPGVAWHTLEVADCAAPVETTPPASPSPSPSPTLGTEPGDDESPAPGAGGGLPVTGVPAGLLAGGAAGVLVLGGGLTWLARRRRLEFTA